MLLQISLSNELLETLNASTTLDFAAQAFFTSLVCLSVFVVGSVVLVYAKVFGFLVYVSFLRFVPGGL